ncbi:APO protein 4, mitochondrial-like [Chenopodium quinoa]|uniref:APO protein 4, mitochondrial-like n=1 Tax=Chenopodium quinoa TaxID=63459 RepID=UPI000B786069|nr:APO protein 4, mitochondrial-like [Chenopodium quinoa]
MALIKHKNWCKILSGMLIANVEINEMGRRWYANNTKIDWNKLRPMIKQRIENRSRGYPIRSMIPIAEEILQARSDVIRGVSALLKVLPVLACKYCPEVHVGETGHLIRSCHGHRRLNKNQAHQWIRASLNDILVPVETFHLDNMVQDVIKHQQRFDFDRVPAVVELCCQAGAISHDLDIQSLNCLSDPTVDLALSGPDSLSADQLRAIGNRTLSAWELLRHGVQKLLLVYSAKVCKYCSEVHVGPSGHKARLCGVFKYQNWRGNHFWEKAGVDDLVPPKMVWFRRPQDPPALLHEDRNYYGHAPAVIDLCMKAGAVPPPKYLCMMKAQGLKGPPPYRSSG